MYCKNCGTEIKKEGNYCPKCGTLLKKPEKRRKSLIILPVLLVLAIPGSVFFFQQYKNVKYKNCMIEGKIYQEQGDIENAKSCYEEAVEVKPDQSEPYDEMLKMHWNLSETEEFVNLAEEAGENTDEKEHFEILEKLGGEYGMYQAYEEIFAEYAQSASGIKLASGILQSYGLVFAELLDFNNDGTDELMLAYTETRYEDTPGTLPYPTNDFKIEVWGYKWDTMDAERDFEGRPLRGENMQWFVQNFMTDDGSVYLRANDKNGESEVYYSYQNESEFQDSRERELKAYALEGDIYDSGILIENPWAERSRTEQELSYREEAIEHTLKRALGLESTREDMPVPQGSYIQDTDEVSMYVNSYLSEENVPALSVWYCVDGHSGNYEFRWNEEKGIYEPGGVSEGQEAVLSVAMTDGNLDVFIQTVNLEDGLQAELMRETEYDTTETAQNIDDAGKEDGQNTENQTVEEEKTYQLDEEGVAYATQQFLDGKQFRTLNITSEYKAADADGVFRYNEAYWVPIYENGGNDPSYYAVIASGAFENPGEATIYPAEIYNLIEGTGKMSDYSGLEEFDTNLYFS